MTLSKPTQFTATNPDMRASGAFGLHGENLIYEDSIDHTCTRMHGPASSRHHQCECGHMWGSGHVPF